MKNTCISHPGREPLVIIRKWQIEFCNSSQCAAAVMSYLEYWHNWKLDSDIYNKKTNDISEMHGDSRILSEDVLQYHTMQEISDGILNLYGIKAIAEALKLLEEKKVISIHANPNKRYHYDKTKYFRFYPGVCEEWLENCYKSRVGENAEWRRQKRNDDMAKTTNRESENALLSGENTLPITKINNKDKNQSIKTRNEFFNDDNALKIQKEEGREKLQLIMDALTKQGFPAKHFQYPDVIETLQRLWEVGATVECFVEAYGVARRVKQSQSFGVNYLAKVVEDLLSKRKQQQTVMEPVAFNSRQPNYQADYSQALHWMGDLISENGE